MKNITKKQLWLKKGIKAGNTTYLCCPDTVQKLDLKTKLYHGFGGWTITKNVQTFFIDKRDVEWDEYKDIQHVEELIGDDDQNEYIADLYLPLRGSTYQRHSKNNWILINKNEGFA